MHLTTGDDNKYSKSNERLSLVPTGGHNLLMNKAPDESRFLGETSSPLFRKLEDIEVEILKIVWSPVIESVQYGLAPQWPVWDFVSRTLPFRKPKCRDPIEVLNGLPSIRRTETIGPPYGLIWRENAFNHVPLPTDHVGLTIAGFFQLESIGVVHENISDQFVDLIRRVAFEEAETKPHPASPVRVEVPLAKFSEWFTNVSREKHYAIPLEVVAQVLEREYARIRVGTSGKCEVSLDGLWLRDYSEITTGRDYVAHVDAASSKPDIPNDEIPFLPLMQTLDYLSYVLQAHPKWNLPERLVAAPDIQSATAFVLPVNSKEDFESRMNGVWNVLNQFHVPDSAMPETERTTSDRNNSGSISQLEFWLKEVLGEAEFSHVSRAIQQIKDVRRIRIADAHSSPSTRNSARQAHMHLGLPEVIVNWPEAWQTVCNRLAWSFDTIQQYIQSDTYASNS